MDISGKVNEAETYRAMGLLEESKIIYEEILSSEKILEKGTSNQFVSAIANIKEEIESLKNGEENTVSEEEIAIIRDTLPITEGVPNIMDRASAFMEWGLYKEALFDYEKLLNNESTWKGVFQGLAACLLKCCDSSEIFPTVREMVARIETNYRIKSEIHFRLGLEMQKHDHKDLAQELYRSAKKLNPDNEEIEKWLDSNDFRQKILSKYDHGFQNRFIQDIKGRLKENIADRIPDEVKLFVCFIVIVLSIISFVVIHL